MKRLSFVFVLVLFFLLIEGIALAGGGSYYDEAEGCTGCGTGGWIVFVVLVVGGLGALYRDEI